MLLTSAQFSRILPPLYSPFSSNEYIVLLRKAIVPTTKIVIRATDTKARLAAKSAPRMIASRNNKPSNEATNRSGSSEEGMSRVNLSIRFKNSV